MKNQKTKSIYYKSSINIGPVRMYNNSRVYEIQAGKSTILPGIKYSLLTLLLGWWGFSIPRIHLFFKGIKNSLEALHINFTGGEDISQLDTDMDYDETTVFIWKNLLRSTKEKISRGDVEIILEIQEEYLSQSREIYSNENIDFIKINLSKLDIHRINSHDIKDIFDAIRIHEQQLSKN